jgi:hypothetical protein
MSRPAGLAWQRALVALGAAVLALALAEGLARALAGRSLLGLAPGPRMLAPRNEAERRSAASGNAGPYAVHRDPRVGYVLRADTVLDVGGVAVRSDALGLRRRTGAAHAGPALRVVVLGDSVAFGLGVADDETLAEQLERRLEALRPPDAPPVEVLTVAQPGWNTRNAVSFLLDHWDVLRPDVVVYLPVANDLDDTNGLLESGFLTPAPDPAQADPWLSSAAGASQALQRKILAGLDEAGLQQLKQRAGPKALDSDLSPESSRRYDDNARLLVELAAVLEREGGHLVVANFIDEPYTQRLQARLEQQPQRIPILPLFTWLQGDMILPDDPHPNAETLGAAATWIAADLVQRGWAPARPDAAAPGAGERFERWRAAPRTPEAALHLAAVARAADRAALRPAVDFSTFEGISQVYGNLNRDGSAGARLTLLLPCGAERLQVELDPLPDRPELYPLTVRVEVDGLQRGSLVLDAQAPACASFPLASPGMRLAHEVRLVPERWVTVTLQDVPQLAAFVPRRVATGE